MIGGTIQSHISAYMEAMNLRTFRQQVLASNIANADTPYYKARDFDFKKTYAERRKEVDDELKEGELALARSNKRHLKPVDPETGIKTRKIPMVLTHEHHIPPPDMAGSLVPLLYRTEYQSAVDGNTVDMDVERGEIADNSLQYQILTQFLTQKFSGLRSAISGNQG
ncbi:MAG: flagellar basal body rod protein FlgB [Zoogloeaceae bacterium]|jgi:flagellar basal-body rod protein FlgB|nr:flagellar basal body rod protein FlgB [Zoogloeaceae bacterium]